LIDENNIYSFSFEYLKNSFSPSGSLNFSRINEGYIQFEINKNIDINNSFLVFSMENFNVLYVKDGMCSLRF
jgi:hypothetical protein